MTEIVARDVHVDYDGHEVLAGVDLHAVPGRMVAVTGPSGAGKTTLLWALAGLVRPGRGTGRGRRRRCPATATRPARPGSC